MQAVKNDGQTALHEAAEAGQKEAVEYLLSVGANAQAQDEVRSMPLSCPYSAVLLSLVRTAQYHFWEGKLGSLHYSPLATVKGACTRYIGSLWSHVACKRLEMTRHAPEGSDGTDTKSQSAITFLIEWRHTCNARSKGRP